MKKKLFDGLSLVPATLSFLLITLLALGIFFRFANIDRKIYWYDETHTSLRVSGYTESEAVQSLSKNQIINIEALQKFQYPNPERSINSIVQNLAIEDAQHPPLYYSIARLWVEWFGNSIAVRRSLSAFLSLLAFPAIYWLCLELFKSPLTGWIAVALIAVSPIQVLYAQEARQYSLWIVTILLSSAALLRAIRLKTKMSWSIYAITAITSLYTFLFSGLVLIGHGVYVIVNEKFRFSRVVSAYLVASSSALLFFLPWLIIVTQGLAKIKKTTAWTANRVSIFDIVREWIYNFNRIFVDWNYGSASSSISKILFYLLAMVLLITVGYSFYFLYRYTSVYIWFFIITLSGVPGIILVGSDLLLGGIRSTIARYLFPCFLGIQLTVAYVVANKISNWNAKIQQKVWQSIAVFLISGGVISCVISSQSQIWWSKYYSNSIPAVANIINQSSNPLLISDTQMGDLLTLSYLLKPNVKMIVNPLCTNCGAFYGTKTEAFLPKIHSRFSDIFFFNLDGYEKWLDKIAKSGKYKVEAASPKLKNKLWKLERY